MVAIDLKPKRTTPWAAVALLLGGIMLASAIEKPSEHHYQTARAALAKGNTEKAERELKLALQDNPLDAQSHFLLGCLLAEKGEHDQAIVGFQRALALDPANAEAQFNLGTLLLRRGEPVRSARLLEKTVLTRPDYVPAYNNLAKAYFLAGIPELSVACYKEALRLDPSNRTALKGLAVLTRAVAVQDGPGGTADGLNNQASNALPVEAKAPVASTEEREDLEGAEVEALQELLRDLPHVTVECRGGRLTLNGWTSGPNERAMLDRILGKPSQVPGTKAPGPVGKPSEVPGTKGPGPVTKPPGVPDKNAPGEVGKPAEILDLTTDDTGDPQRMIEIDSVLFIVTALDSQSVGFNFLKEINLNFNYFAADNKRAGIGYQAPPNLTGPVTGLSQEGWIFGASADYVVNIANASAQRVAVLARPHLSALSGTPADFIAGGELVYQVTGNIGGNIYPYPFGTTLKVTPTLLRTLAEDSTPRVHIKVEAGRLSVLSLLNADPNKPTAFDKVNVTSEAVLTLGQTLILSGLSQRERRTGREGVPVLMDIPLLKYLFSTRTTTVADSSVIILLTPRDPAYWDEQYMKSTHEFLEMRRAFLRASQGTEEDIRRYRQRYPGWAQIPPNHFATHFVLMENSEAYRTVSGQDLTSEDVDLELLGPKPNEKKRPSK